MPQSKVCRMIRLSTSNTIDTLLENIIITRAVSSSRSSPKPAQRLIRGFFRWR